MKTMNSNLQKKEIKALTIVIALFATIFTLNVKGAVFNEEMKTNEGMNAFTSYLTEEKDTEMKLESWMINRDNFFLDYRLEVVTEKPLELESWMTEATLFTFVASLEPEADEILNLEQWMVDYRYWKK